jgi:AcrR family transcriptional regulator
MPRPENEDREQRILDAAADLIVHYGYDKTTINDIASQAGISKGAVYLHFQSKDDLFESLLSREMRTYAERWLALVDADPDGGRLAGMYKNMLYALDSSPFMAAMFKQDRRVFGSYLRKPGNFFQRQDQGSRYAFVSLMQEAGAIRPDLDPAIVAHIMNILTYGLVAMDEIMDPADIPPTADVIEGIAAIMDRALTPDDGGDPAAGKAIIHQIADAARQQITSSIETEDPA